MDGSDIQPQTLHPVPLEAPRGLPDSVLRAWNQASEVRRINANAYAVLLGRVLELVCRDRNARGDALYAQMQDLQSKGEVPPKVNQIMQNLRKLRNFGAPASLGELSESEVPVLHDLARAVLEYVYTAPFLAERAQTTFQRLMETRDLR